MSSHNTMKPTGGVSVRRVMEAPALDDYLLKWILSRPNMQKAWKQVKANAGDPGIDGVSVDEFPAKTRES